MHILPSHLCVPDQEGVGECGESAGVPAVPQFRRRHGLGVCIAAAGAALYRLRQAEQT